MIDAQVLHWPWWMAPARWIGRLRPGLLAAAQSDAIVLGRLPRAIVDLGLPLFVLIVAGIASATHATDVLQHPSVHIDWLRFVVDDVFTESAPFILGAIAIGLFSPALGVLFVAVFGAMDLVAAAAQVYELKPLPGALVGRLVALWLLWLLVVEVPVLARILASSVRRLADSRIAVAAMSAVAAAGFTFLWTQAAAVLIRPVFTWSSLPSGVRLEAIQPIQIGGMVFAVAAGLIAAAVALPRGPGGLLYLDVAGGRSGAGVPAVGPGALAVAVGRRLIVAGLLTVALGGLITTWLDAAVLFVALAGARPLARWIVQRSAIGVVAERVPPIVRVALAIAVVYGVALVTVGTALLMKVSEFFSVIAAVAIGLFVVELVTASRSGSVAPRPSAARAAGLGAALGLGLLAIGLAAPLSVFADNCASFNDCWSSVAAAILAAVAVPTLFALGASERFLNWYADQLLGPKTPPPPPKPPLTWDSRTPRQIRDQKKFHDSDTYKEETE